MTAMMVEAAGFEPATSCVQSRRSSGLSYAPRVVCDGAESGITPFAKALTIGNFRLSGQANAYLRMVAAAGVEPATSHFSGGRSPN